MHDYEKGVREYGMMDGSLDYRVQPILSNINESENGNENINRYIEWKIGQQKVQYDGKEFRMIKEKEWNRDYFYKGRDYRLKMKEIRDEGRLEGIDVIGEFINKSKTKYIQLVEERENQQQKGRMAVKREIIKERGQNREQIEAILKRGIEGGSRIIIKKKEGEGIEGMMERIQ